MHGGKRIGSGRKKKTEQLKRDLLTIRLPNWMILQIKNKGEIGYIIENQLIKMDFLNIPNDYIKGS
jgi:type III secretory pathway component EscR